MDQAECLSADELAFHRKIVAQLERDQYVWEMWKTHLAEAHSYPVGTIIDAAGAVHRPAPPPPAAE